MCVFKYHVPDLLDSFVFRDLIRSFEIRCPCCPVGPSWDLVKVLTYLRGSMFEPLSSKPLWVVTMKVAFLLALATAKRVGELQALSVLVGSRGPNISLVYLLEFVVKTESERNPLPRSFLIRSLEKLVGNLPEGHFLCSVLAVWIYLDLTSTLSPRPRSLFVSSWRPSCLLSKNALSFFLRQVILDSGAMGKGTSLPHAHSVRAVAASALVGLQGT